MWNNRSIARQKSLTDLMMKKIELHIVALKLSVTQSHNYAVVLGENDGSRRLPIIIGGYEAQAIAVAMERMIPKRPLTHDLFKNTLDIFNIVLREVIINDLEEGVFYATLVCWKDGEIVEIDARTSDAMALAVRFKCPIFTYESVMDAAGVIIEETDEEDGGEEGYLDDDDDLMGESLSLDARTVTELQEMLDEMLRQEDYEAAAEIRDEINRRKGKES